MAKKKAPKNVKALDKKSMKKTQGGFSGGVFVAAGDVNGDNVAVGDVNGDLAAGFLNKSKLQR